MSKRTYEEYIKNDCHPVGYNEACQSYYFGQTTVDLLLDRIDQLNLQLKDYEKRISQEQELMSNMEHRLTKKQNTSGGRALIPVEKEIK